MLCGSFVHGIQDRSGSLRIFQVVFYFFFLRYCDTYFLKHQFLTSRRNQLHPNPGGLCYHLTALNKIVVFLNCGNRIHRSAAIWLYLLLYPRCSTTSHASGLALHRTSYFVLYHRWLTVSSASPRTLQIIGYSVLCSWYWNISLYSARTLDSTRSFALYDLCSTVSSASERTLQTKRRFVLHDRCSTVPSASARAVYRTRYLCCIIDAQLFLQPQGVIQETTMWLTLANGIICREITLCQLYYMFDAHLFLRPQIGHCLLSYFWYVILYSALQLTSQGTIVWLVTDQLTHSLFHSPTTNVCEWNVSDTFVWNIA